MKNIPIAAIGLLVVLVGACSQTEEDPTFCSEDISCDRPDEIGDKNFCDIDKLYPGHELTNQCIPRPDEVACNRAEPCRSTSKPYCDDVAMFAKGTCVECVEPSHCDTGETCDSANVCVDLSCTPGADGDAICAQINSETPYCAVQDVCRECLNTSHCEGENICDQQTFTCRGCAAHDECDSGACDIDGATCVAEAAIIHVAETSGSDTGSCGSVASPCATIKYALEDQVTPTRNMVIIAAGNYGDPLSISTGTVTLVANGNVIVAPTLNIGTPVALTISGTANLSVSGVSIIPASGTTGTDAVSCSGAGASLALSGVTVSNAADIGVQSSDCALTVTGSTISANDGGGIDTTGGLVTVTGSTISANDGGGIDVTSADYEIVNNFIVRNGTDLSVVGGMRISGTKTHSEVLEFNTFVGNTRGGAGHALVCDVSDLIAANNIFMHFDGGTAATLVTECSPVYSLFADATTMPVGNGNLSADASFVDPGNSNFHLQSGSEGIDKADPGATLDTDFDGDDRPNNARSDMGADEVL